MQARTAQHALWIEIKDVLWSNHGVCRSGDGCYGPFFFSVLDKGTSGPCLWPRGLIMQHFVLSLSKGVVLTTFRALCPPAVSYLGSWGTPAQFLAGLPARRGMVATLRTRDKLESILTEYSAESLHTGQPPVFSVFPFSEFLGTLDDSHHFSFTYGMPVAPKAGVQQITVKCHDAGSRQ